MSDDQIQQSMHLQQQISERLAELAYADVQQAKRVSRHLAEIAIRGKMIADTTIPLFIEMSRESRPALARVAIALKLQLQELADALSDIEPELADWEEFFRISGMD